MWRVFFSLVCMFMAFVIPFPATAQLACSSNEPHEHTVFACTMGTKILSICYANYPKENIWLYFKDPSNPTEKVITSGGLLPNPRLSRSVYDNRTILRFGERSTGQAFSVYVNTKTDEAGLIVEKKGKVRAVFPCIGAPTYALPALLLEHFPIR